MGINTALMLSNDQIYRIVEEKDLADLLFRAINAVGSKPIEVCPGLKVLGSVHSSGVLVTTVGGNTGSVLGSCGEGVRDPLGILRELASQYGYVLRKKSKAHKKRKR